MTKRQSTAWLISDARNDALLEAALRRMPRGSGFIFRHYHLDEQQRRARFVKLARIARCCGHRVALAAGVRSARRWGADGAYGPAAVLAKGPAALRLVTIHSFKQLGKAHRADAVLLSPVFATRSHPGALQLGALRFRLIAARAKVPVIALGGMTQLRARQLQTSNWAAIDGICGEANRWNPKDS